MKNFFFIALIFMALMPEELIAQFNHSTSEVKLIDPTKKLLIATPEFNSISNNFKLKVYNRAVSGGYMGTVRGQNSEFRSYSGDISNAYYNFTIHDFNAYPGPGSSYDLLKASFYDGTKELSYFRVGANGLTTLGQHSHLNDYPRILVAYGDVLVHGKIGIGTNNALYKFQVNAGLNQNFGITSNQSKLTLKAFNESDNLTDMVIEAKKLEVKFDSHVGGHPSFLVAGHSHFQKITLGAVDNSGFPNFNLHSREILRAVNHAGNGALGFSIFLDPDKTILRSGSYGENSRNGNIYIDAEKVMIGTQCAPPMPGLAVKGRIYSEGVSVMPIRTSGCWWPDYVFANDYKLMSLNEVESYIYKNQHLPEVPSASVIEAKGIDVAEMDAILLKKIEELTLYLIGQNKKIEEQALQIQQLQEHLINK